MRAGTTRRDNFKSLQDNKLNCGRRSAAQMPLFPGRAISGARRGLTNHEKARRAGNDRNIDRPLILGSGKQA